MGKRRRRVVFDLFAPAQGAESRSTTALSVETLGLPIDRVHTLFGLVAAVKPNWSTERRVSSLSAGAR